MSKLSDQLIRVTMDQQSNEEDKPKISRSKARHLRRKRLAAARRTDESSSFSTQSNTEQDSSLQEPQDILSKSKARRLRKKKKAELIKGSGQTLKAEKRASNSENQTELVTSSQSPTNVSEYERSDRNISAIQFEAVDSSESTNSLASLSEIKVLNSNPDGVFSPINRENDTLLAYQLNSSLHTVSNNKNLGKVQNESDSISSDDFHGHEAGFVTSSSQHDYQIPKDSDYKVLPQDKSIDVDTRTELHQTSFESDIDSEIFDSNKSLGDNQILIWDQKPDFKLTGSSKISHFKSNQLSKNNAVIEENVDVESQRKKKDENKSDNTLHGLDINSSNPIRKTLCSLKPDGTSDDDLDSPSSNSSSNLMNQYEVNAIQAHDSLGLITRPTKTVLNTTELIENEKNLKISNNSSNFHTGFQPNTTVIDLTYSSSDLIINTDDIIDFISDSSLDLVENNKLFYIDPPATSSTDSENKTQIHKNFITERLLASENQTSFDIIKDYSLPSTSVTGSVSPVFKNSKGSVGYNKTFEDLYEEKMSSTEKTREQVKAEREAKKAAKALAKGKAKTPKSEVKSDVKINKDMAKAGSSEQIQKDVKQNVVVKTDRVEKDIKDNTVVKKRTVPQEEMIVQIETETPPSTDNKENESRGEVDGKSKRESRAERRAKQEAQRAAKQKLIAEKNKPKSVVPPKLKSLPKDTDSVKIVRKTLIENNLHEVKLFKHLYHEREQSLVNFPTLNSHIHPAIVRLGVQYANKVIIGSNARCVALLAAVKQLVEDFERPSQADFTRGLEASLQECAAYLQHCRPMAVSMQNALKHLKWQMTQLPSTVSDDDAKSKLGDAIDTYIREQILLAGKAISNTIQTKISNGDVILTYAFSSLIHNILIDAQIAGKQFRVIVVDGRPWLEGKEQLRRLAKHGIECSYILINALSFIMPEVTKVFLGAHAILANGAVMSRAGTAQVALMAKAFNVPVLVACETHKSCERVQTDSFVYNEIGDADELACNLFSNSKKSLLVNWKTKKSLDLLNITYDVTPADLVSAVVTELAILPCTSIPVILRIKPSEI